MEQDDDAMILEGVNIKAENELQQNDIFKYTEEETGKLRNNKKLREIVNLKGKTQNLEKIKTKISKSKNVVPTDLNDLIYG